MFGIKSTKIRIQNCKDKVQWKLLLCLTYEMCLDSLSYEKYDFKTKWFNWLSD